MKVHHLNCGCMCPIGASLFPTVFPKKVICHCLLLETKVGLILIDTGFSKSVLEKPKRMGVLYPFLGLQKSSDISAVNQVLRLGFKIEDFTHVIPTHLDVDHAGGISDFPTAKVHASDRELEAVLRPRGIPERARYQGFSIGDLSRWQIHSFDAGENWFGFKAVHAVPQLEDEVLLIPLFGHTRGHYGVAVKNNGKWLFHVGDAYYFHSELNVEKSFSLKLFQRSVHWDFEKAMENQKRLMQLKSAHSSEIQMFSAHDPYEML